MYYHVLIRLSGKSSLIFLEELDKTNTDEIIKDVFLPYLREEEFFFNGRMLNKTLISSLQVYKTEQESQRLIDIQREKNRNNNIFDTTLSPRKVVTYTTYSKDITKIIFQKSKEELDTKPQINKSKKSYDKNKVFIVHGHNNEVKLEVARFIEKMGFKPIILHEQASNSQTIIEKIESYSDVGFGIVIYTPCDVGAINSENPKLNYRARQNVVFEHGFLIGKLGRSNICSLVKGEVETPNDISGIVYTSMDSTNWHIELAKEMKASGYAVDMNKVI